MIFNNTPRNTKLMLLLDFFQADGHYTALRECTCEADIMPKAFTKLSGPLKKAFIYVTTLSIASNQAFCSQAEFTTKYDTHRFPSQLMRKVAHLIVELILGNKMEEHFNQQEREIELVSFLALGIKTVAMGGSICKSGIHSSTSASEDTHLNQAFAHN